MVSESTPLTGIPAVIGDPMVQELASAAMAKGKEMIKLATRGDGSIRTLVIFTGVIVSITSLMGLPGKILTLDVAGALLNLYTAVFGVIAALIESGKDKNPFGIRQILSRYFSFLDVVTGRSAFYLFVGTMKAAQGDIVSWAVGAFMCFVGVLHYTVGQSIARKIKNLRQKLYTEDQLKKLFNNADKRRSGALNLDEFSKLVVELGVKLDKRELELAFVGLDKNYDGTVDFSEFYNNFWKDGEFNELNFQFAMAV